MNSMKPSGKPRQIRVCCNKPWLAVLLFLLMQSAQAQPAQAPDIEYASPDQSIWTTRINAAGEPDNPLHSLATALFGKAGMSWHGKSYPAVRLFKQLEEGAPHFSMLVKAPALQACCLWSKKPVTTAEIRIYRLADKTPIRSTEEMLGKHVITIRGYSYGGLRNFITDEKNRVRNSESPSHAAAFRMLASGRADYLIDYTGPATEILDTEPIDNIRSDVLLRQDVYMVLAKSHPEADKLMARLEHIAGSLDIPRILKAHRK